MNISLNQTEDKRLVQRAVVEHAERCGYITRRQMFNKPVVYEASYAYGASVVDDWIMDVLKPTGGQRGPDCHWVKR